MGAPALTMLSLRWVHVGQIFEDIERADTAHLMHLSPPRCPIRMLNLELLQNYGASVWLAHNKVVEGMETALTAKVRPSSIPQLPRPSLELTLAYLQDQRLEP